MRTGVGKGKYSWWRKKDIFHASLHDWLVEHIAVRYHWGQEFGNVEKELDILIDHKNN